MAELFTIGNLMTLLMLILLQAVLGFDNLLYISIESKRVAEDKQKFVRKLGIGLAIGLRIILLVVVVKMTKSFQDPLFEIHVQNFIDGEFNLQSLITIVGGAFILYTAVKEIHHMLAIEHLEGQGDEKPRSVNLTIFWIVLMNLVFSFDSILSAMALTDNLIVMTIAIIVSGLLMIYMADHVAEFLKKNRMYEVLGLFILFIVGVMLVTEGGHSAHMKLLGNPVHAMTKTTFYFVLFVLVIVDVVQGHYQKKLEAMRAREAGSS
jgi:predicted tellurium resistance membrane protein TerC